jgi:aminopeptidase N
VITVEKPLTAVANGVLRSVKDLGAARRFTFEQKQPMASYLAIADIGRYKVEKQSFRGMPIRHYITDATPPETLANFRKVPAMLAFIQGVVGPYPFDACGSVVVSDPELYYVLETQAMSTYRDARVPESTVLHEALHQWFGDAVTVAEWRDLWLAEGFATYFEYLWEFRNSGADFNKAIRELYRYAVRNEVDPAVVSRPGDIFADNTYVRGALTLHALRLKVGDEAFFKILRTYYGRYRHGNATSADFIRVAVKEGKADGVRELLNAWLFEVPVPPLTRGTEAAAVAAEVGPVTLPIPLDTPRRK